MKHSDDYQPGDKLGRYEIIRELATGGMATIYLARVSGTAGFEKLVVLKCILPSLARDKGFITMFLDEARLAATLRHANIAEVIDVGYEDSTYFFAMEYVHGQNARAVRIAARERRQPIPLEVALAIIAGTASALGHAHDRSGPQGPLGLVHRDVSPTNVIVGYEGAIKLVDFGIARATMRRGAKTRTGLRRGKAPYMSPEQCRGRQLDRRTDLFSLGTMLYELTVGARPFLGGTDFEVMDAIVRGSFSPPSHVVDDYPPDLEAIVMRLLAAAPESRYQSATSLLEDLETYIAEHRILTSAHVIARHMVELFGEAATAPFERTSVTGSTTREYPEGRPPRGLFPDEEPTVAYQEAEHLAELKASLRIKRPSTHPGLGEEATHFDPVLPFDPIDARSVEILDQLDADAPDGEHADERALRRINKLMELALGWLRDGETDKAVTAVELALEEDLHIPATQQALQRHVETIVIVYEGMLEDPYRKLTLVRSLAEVVALTIEPRARLLLPFIDGEATVIQILERSGMERLEAYHHLCQLIMRGIIG